MVRKGSREVQELRRLSRPDTPTITELSVGDHYRAFNTCSRVDLETLVGTGERGRASARCCSDAEANPVYDRMSYGSALRLSSRHKCHKIDYEFIAFADQLAGRRIKKQLGAMHSVIDIDTKRGSAIR